MCLVTASETAIDAMAAAIVAAAAAAAGEEIRRSLALVWRIVPICRQDKVEAVNHAVTRVSC
jgi:peroxiredoxin family protein